MDLRKEKPTKTNIFDIIWPEYKETCPQCGRPFIRTCRKDEWGYRERSMTGTVLLCSWKCCREYEKRMFMESVRAVANSDVFKTYRLVMLNDMTQAEAMKITGVSNYSRVHDMLNHKWKELEWLEAHNWEADG